MSRDVSAGVRARLDGLLQALVESGAESGLQVAVYVDGEQLVSSCAGTYDPPGSRSPEPDAPATAAAPASAASAATADAATAAPATAATASAPVSSASASSAAGTAAVSSAPVSSAAATAAVVAPVPLAPGTLIHSFSTGKGFMATLVHVLAERGLIDYDTPIARYWPEFAAHGKGRATVRDALAHRIGIPQLAPGITPAELCDWDTMCAVVADLAPLWEPGTDSGYHGWTFGWILGEPVRRITGLAPAEALRRYVTEPLGIADELYFGLPEAELPRLAPLVEGNWAAWLEDLPPSVPFRRFVVPNRGVWTTAGLANRRDYLLADIPAGGTTTARAAARMYAALLGEVDGVRLISPERLEEVTAVVVQGKDRMLLGRFAKGLGYFLGLPEMGGERTAFGHHGSGGSIAFADRERGLAFALTRTRLVGGEADRAAQLVADEIRSHVPKTAAP